MSPRPRKVSDDEVMAAAARVMMRQGPAQITLAEIAAEAGVTAGALVQRYGSKRELLLALMEAFAASRGEMVEQLRAVHGTALEAVRGYAVWMAGMAPTPAALAHHLSYLQMDLTDPDFHRYAKAQAVATRRGLETLLAEAMSRGDLAAGDAAALARAVEVTVAGSLLVWAMHEEGAAVDWVLREVDRVLSSRVG